MNVLETISQQYPELVPLVGRIAQKHGCTVEQVLGRDRAGYSVARARRELWSVAHGTLGLSLPQLGRLFGRDHTTVMYALRKRERELRGAA